jgi:uncharacterized membrane protein
MVNMEKTSRFNENSEDSQKFLILIIIGFLLTFAGIIILILAAIICGEGSANFGALLFIGPIPIIVGFGPEAPMVVLLAIILTVLSIIMFLIIRREEKQKA